MNPSDLPESWPPNKQDLEGEGDSNSGSDILDPPMGDVELAKSLALEVPRAFLWERCVALVEQKCQLVDLEVLWTRSVAQVVVGLLGVSPLHWIRGVPVPKEHKDHAQEWIDERIEEAIEDLGLEDEEAYMDGVLQPDPEEPRHTGLTQSYGVDPDTVVAAAVRFNRLDQNLRQAFFAIFIERIDLNECAPKGLGSPDQVKAQAQKALKTLLTPDLPLFDPYLEDLS